jgi:hypothetical protein
MRGKGMINEQSEIPKHYICTSGGAPQCTSHEQNHAAKKCRHERASTNALRLGSRHLTNTARVFASARSFKMTLTDLVTGIVIVLGVLLVRVNPFLSV